MRGCKYKMTLIQKFQISFSFDPGTLGLEHESEPSVDLAFA